MNERDRLIHKSEGGRMNREETENQIALFEWAKLNKGRFPEIEAMYHIPNEGKRSQRFGAELKSMGLRKGFPDVCLPVPRRESGALYIELKAPSGTISKEQMEWIRLLNDLRNSACVCYGWETAAKVITDYLQGKLPTQEVYK